MRNCLSLNTPLTAGISREQTETTSNEALLTSKERSTTIPQGSRTKPSEMGSENTKIWRFIKKYQ